MGFGKTAKEKKLRKAIRLPSHFVHHDLMPRKGQRQQQQQKSSFIIHHPFIHPSSIVPSSFQFRKSQHKAFAIFSAFRFKLWEGENVFPICGSPKAPSNVAPEASKKRQIDQLSNHGKPTQMWRLSKLPKKNLKNQYHCDFKRRNDTSGCRKRSGCFCWRWMEGATRHSLRKNSLEKVTRRVAVDGKAQLLEAPSSRKNRSYVPGIKIGKTANPVGRLTPKTSTKIPGVWFFGIKIGSKLKLIVEKWMNFCNFEDKNASGTWNRKRLTDLS